MSVEQNKFWLFCALSSDLGHALLYLMKSSSIVPLSTHMIAQFLVGFYL